MYIFGAFFVLTMLSHYAGVLGEGEGQGVLSGGLSQTSNTNVVTPALVRHTFSWIFTSRLVCPPHFFKDAEFSIQYFASVTEDADADARRRHISFAPRWPVLKSTGSGTDANCCRRHILSFGKGVTSPGGSSQIGHSICFSPRKWTIHERIIFSENLVTHSTPPPHFLGRLKIERVGVAFSSTFSAPWL